MRIRADARCPNTYYEEMMKKDFNKWNKMQIVAFINMNSDEDNQVTMRPRKSTLVKRAENIVLMAEAEKELDPKKSDNMLERFMGGTLLVFTKIFIAIIALEFLNAATLDLPPGEFFGVLAVLFLLVGIPLIVWKWERE